MLVRFLVLAVALTIAGPALAVQPSADAPTPPANDFGFEFWVGKHVDELRAAHGEPRKVKKGALVYRVLIFCGSEMYGPHYDEWGDMRVAPLPHDESGFPHPRRPAAKKITVAFRIGENDLITGYEVLRIKHKKCPE
jgi:hypothetical protein